MEERHSRSAEMPCVVCGHSNRTGWHLTEGQGVRLSLARCDVCGHVYQCPPVDKSHAERFYADAYGSEGDPHPYFEPQLKRKHAEELLRELRSRCPGASRILEVGSGGGAFVRVGRDAGLDVVGTEMSPEAVAQAEKLFGVDLHLGAVEDLPPAAPFDAVVLWDVIEHCPRPDAVLAAIVARLRPGGTLLLTTGNYESAGRLVGGPLWWCWAADHYHYFSPAGVKRLGERLGLTDFRIAPVARLQAPSAPSERPSPLRLLNPLHDLRGVRNRGLQLWARWRWPHHWNIGVMLCQMEKPAQG